MDQYKKELSVFDKAKKPQEKGVLKKSLLIVVIIVFIISAFFAGVFFGLEQAPYFEFMDGLPNRYGQVKNQQGGIPNFLRKDVNFDIYWDAWKILQDRYVENDVADIKMFYGSMAGMVMGLGDPYTVFFDPKANEEFSRELEGNFDGIGAEIAVKRGQLMIVAPLRGTPADKAGVMAGDFILSIDDVNTNGMSVNEAVFRIRGQRGTQVTLEIYRDGFEVPEKFYIIRDKIELKSVVYEMKDDVALIELSHFSLDTTSEFNKAVQQIITKNPKGIVLDLRNNPGGYVEMAIQVASEWVEDGPVMIETGRDDKNDEFKAQGQARLKDFKTIVLVNGGTASGSEIVAGALQDYGLATILGEQTFGKGSVQEIQQLKDGSAIKITVAKWSTPKGRFISDEGIKPDVEIELTREDFDNDNDPQLKRALELIGE